MNHNGFFSQEELEGLLEMEARLEATRLEMECREKYRRRIKIRRVVFVVAVATIVFTLPGLVVLLIGTHLNILQLLAIDIIAALFFHPMQLLAIDWGCSWSDISLGGHSGHR